VNKKFMLQLKLRYQTGATMIEILVAVTVFSIAMAGMAAMTLNNVRSTSSAATRSQAVILADQLAETMRTNMTAYETGSFTATPGGTAVNCVGAECDAATIADFDATVWRTRVTSMLPGGQAFFCVDSSPDDGIPTALACDGAGTNVIKIFWTNTRFIAERQEGATDWRRLVMPVVP